MLGWFGEWVDVLLFSTIFFEFLLDFFWHFQEGGFFEKRMRIFLMGLLWCGRGVGHGGGDGEERLFGLVFLGGGERKFGCDRLTSSG